MIFDLKAGMTIHPLRVLEKEVQNHVFENLQALFGVEPITKEYRVHFGQRIGRVDILGVDKNGRLVIFELKADKSRTVINQAVDYCIAFRDNIQRVVDSVNNDFKPQCKVKHLPPRVICIAQSYHPSDINLHTALNISVELYVYTMYPNNILSLNLWDPSGSHVVLDQLPEPVTTMSPLTVLLSDFFAYTQSLGLSPSDHQPLVYMKHSPSSRDDSGTYGNMNKRPACVYGRDLILVKIESIVSLLNSRPQSHQYNLSAIMDDVEILFSRSEQHPENPDNLVLAPKQYKHKIHGMFTALNASKLHNILSV